MITTELILADLAAVKKRAERVQKGARSGDKLAKAELALCEKIQPHLDSGKPALTARLSDEERTVLKGFFLLTSKPVILACNVGENELAQADNPHIRAVREFAAAQNAGAIGSAPLVSRLLLSARKLRANWPNCRLKRLANSFLISVWQTAE